MKFWQRQDNARTATRRLLWTFAGAVLVLLAAEHGALALVWWWLMALMLPVPLPEPAGLLTAHVGVSLLLVLGGWWVDTENLRAGGLKFAARMGAREARSSVSCAEQRLCNVVGELCICGPHGTPKGHGAVARRRHQRLTRLEMRLTGMVFGLALVSNFGSELRERGGLAWWFGSAIMLAGFTGWLTGRLLKAAVSRQREHLADARAVQCIYGGLPWRRCRWCP